MYTANNLTFTMTRIGVFSSCLLFLFLFVSFQSFPVWFLSSYFCCCSLSGCTWYVVCVVFFVVISNISPLLHFVTMDSCMCLCMKHGEFTFFGFGLSTKLKRVLSQTIHRLRVYTTTCLEFKKKAQAENERAAAAIEREKHTKK